MKLRIAFSVSKDERWLRLSLWGWDIWRSDFDDEFADLEFSGAAEKKTSKAGSLSFKKTVEESGEETEPSQKDANDGEFGKLMFQALFYPDVESRIWRVFKKMLNWMYKLFTVKFENIEIKGSLGDPFYDAMVYGISAGCYEPNWKDENENWSAKGEIALKANLFYFMFFILAAIYETAILAFILWRGTRLARGNPNGENLSEIRRWIFLKAREAA